MHRRFRSRFVPLALLGALTVAPACKGDKDQAADTGTPADGEGKGDAPAEPEAPGQAPTPATNPAGATGPGAEPVDSPPIAERGPVVATAQIPTGTNMTDLAAAIDAIQPGVSMMAKAQLPNMLKEAAGFDVGKGAKLDAPISVVVLDPSAHPQPIAVLVTVADEATLSSGAKDAGWAIELQGGLALLGPADAVTAAKDFAFTNLAKAPDHSEIIIYPQRLMTSYAGQIDAALAGLTGPLAAQGNEPMAKMMRGYADAVMGLAQQSDRIVLSVASSPAGSDLVAHVYPVADTTFAKFVAAQVASDHALLAKLPSGSEGMIMSGNIHAGPARDAFVDFSIDMLGPMYGGMPAEEWRALMLPWLDALDGRFAMSMTMGMNQAPGQLPAMTVSMSALMGVDDSAKLWTSWREMLTKMATGPGMELMGMKITATHEQKVIEHDGVEVDRYASKVDTSAMPAQQAAAVDAAQASQAMHMAAFDNVAVMATADPEGQAIKAVIDSARGKGTALTPSPTFAAALANGKARGDSMLVFMDIAALAANAGGKPPQAPFKALAMSMGQHDGALSFRVSLLK